MRNISAELQSRFDTGATTMCRCWLIARQDGVKFGFTDHDRNLVVDGEVFKAGTGLDASVIETSSGLSVDNGQAVGALTDAGITEEDIIAGRFDGAEVYQWLVDWRKPKLKVLLFKGFLGEIRRGSSAFEVELRGLSETLNKPVGRSYLRECDRILGDSKCGLNIAAPAFSTEATVLSASANRQINFAGMSGFQEKWFEGGIVRWTSGANIGLASLIKVDAVNGVERVIDIWEATRLPIDVGDTAVIVAGCDKRAETCRAKFDNFLNFRGFPHIPGEDWVTAYPSGGETYDGRSLSGTSVAG